jgi:hypothetical protein
MVGRHPDVFGASDGSRQARMISRAMVLTIFKQPQSPLPAGSNVCVFDHAVTTPNPWPLGKGLCCSLSG